MNQSNEKRKQTEKTYQIGEFMLLLKCIYSLDNTGVNRCVSSFHYHIASIHQSRVFKTTSSEVTHRLLTIDFSLSVTLVIAIRLQQAS